MEPALITITKSDTSARNSSLEMVVNLKKHYFHFLLQIFSPTTSLSYWNWKIILYVMPWNSGAFTASKSVHSTCKHRIVGAKEMKFQKLWILFFIIMSLTNIAESSNRKIWIRLYFTCSSQASVCVVCVCEYYIYIYIYM